MSGYEKLFPSKTHKQIEEEKRLDRRAVMESRIKRETGRRELIEKQQAVKRDRKLREAKAEAQKKEVEARLEAAKRRLKKVEKGKLRRILLGPPKRKKRRSSAW
jgi:hypothetical protein